VWEVPSRSRARRAPPACTARWRSWWRCCTPPATSPTARS
jgi:hypothetical protein